METYLFASFKGQQRCQVTFPEGGPDPHDSVQQSESPFGTKICVQMQQPEQREALRQTRQPSVRDKAEAAREERRRPDSYSG